MDHIKRADRLGAITRILTATPNRLHGYAEFCELFGAAKSTISEDIDIIANSISRFAEGRVETIAGASGGVRFRPLPSKKRMRETLNGLCARLSQPGRLLPGGFVYTSDLTSESDAVWSIGEILAAEFYDAEPDVVLTMETKGIPVALMTAEALHVPLIIARRSSKVYEGSAVNINYVSGKGGIETMSLSRRAVREGGSALIVDDFMRGGGTARSMLSLLSEFNVKAVGMCFVLAMEHPAQRFVEGEKALMLLGDIRDGEPSQVRVADWVK